MKKAIVPICVILFIVFTGCYLIIMEYAKQRAADRVANEAVSEIKEEEAFSEPDEGIQGILTGINAEDGIMGFQDIRSGKLYEIPYDSNLEVKNKYGDIMSMAELVNGEIFKLYYTRSLKKLTGIQVSDTTWTYTDVRKFSFDEHKKIMMIGDEAYKFTKALRIYSLNEEAQIMDINEMDTLTVRGIEKEVLSVVVDKGHGYVRVLNDAYFVGGWIEIGQDIIKPVTEDMLIPVGEGDYLIKVTNRGYAGEEEVRVLRDKETKLDLSKIEIEEVAIGHVLFKIDPDYARLYIDDEITEFEERVPLEFGVHSIRVECAGYNTIHSNIKVGSDYAEIDITMDEESEDNISTSSTQKNASISDNKTVSGNKAESSTSFTANGTEALSATYPAATSSSEAAETDSGSSSSSSSTTTTASSSAVGTVISGEKKIYVEQPSGTEVYLDGNYIGIAPASTAKVTGSHVITLSRQGCQTKSYTVNIANDGNDVTFSFSALIEQ